MDKDKIKCAFESALSQLHPERKIAILAILAHNITIGVRGIHSDQSNSPDAIEKLYALNEVQHTITARLMNIASEQDKWQEDAFVNALFESARQGSCEGELIWAMSFTLSAV